MDQDLDKQARIEAARIMGRAKSEKKAAAVRINGKLGGRPRKAPKESLTKPEETICNTS